MVRITDTLTASTAQTDTIGAIVARAAVPVSPVTALATAATVPRAVALLPCSDFPVSPCLSAKGEEPVVELVSIFKAFLKSQPKQTAHEMDLARVVVRRVINRFPLLDPRIVGLAEVRDVHILLDAVEQPLTRDLWQIDPRRTRLLVAALEDPRHKARMKLDGRASKEVLQGQNVERVLARRAAAAGRGRASVAPFAARTVDAGAAIGPAIARRAAASGGEVLGRFDSSLGVVSTIVKIARHLIRCARPPR